MEDYGQRVTVTFATDEAARRARVRVAPLLGDRAWAVTCRWDDKNEADLQMRDVMAAHGYRGDFYLNAPNRGLGADVARRLLEGGNRIGGHSMTHPYLPYVSRNRLFWDEADAMFFDRSAAVRTWEAREVNVLLQEMERFEGVCVLATNRVVSLDPALERRISMKVRFERPDLEMRRQIWHVLLPRAVPLAGDVRVDALAQEDLTGGEIKNVILNASRLALWRSDKGPVSMADFREAVRMEVEGKWNKGSGEIGFRRSGCTVTAPFGLPSPLGPTSL